VLGRQALRLNQRCPAPLSSHDNASPLAVSSRLISLLIPHYFIQYLQVDPAVRALAQFLQGFGRRLSAAFDAYEKLGSYLE
jgi:hypothetical protein